MSSKGNMKFWCGLLVVLALLGAAGSYLFSKWELNNRNLEELKQRYAQSRVPVETAANVTRGISAIVSKEIESDHKVVETLNITFRSVGLNRVSPGADQELAFNMLSEMRGSTYFDATNTRATAEISPEVPLKEPPLEGKEGEPGTFSFKIVAKLKHPLTL
jgi:hypothetical protein